MENLQAKHSKLLITSRLIALITVIFTMVNCGQGRPTPIGVSLTPAVTIKVQPISPPPVVTIHVVPLPSSPQVSPEATSHSSPTAHATAVSNHLNEKLFTLCWIAYAPTNSNPDSGIVPPEESIREDLRVLRGAGFNGLVTYGADRTIPRVAQEVGFQSMVLGVWDPTNSTEISIAKDTAQYDFVIGYVVGNEGLDQRYDYATLKAVMDALRQATGKPVATTEEWEDYTDARP